MKSQYMISIKRTISILTIIFANHLSYSICLLDSGPKSIKSQMYQNFQFMLHWILCLIFNVVFTVLMIMHVRDLNLTKLLALFSKILSLILRLNFKLGSTQFCQVSWIIFLRKLILSLFSRKLSWLWQTLHWKYPL